MGIVVSPSELDVDPVLAAGGAVVGVFVVVEERRLAHLPFEGREKEDVCAGRIHLVGFSGMDSFVLD